MEKKELMAKAAFLEKLGHLLSGGLPLARSLKLLDAETTDAGLKKVIKRLLDSMGGLQPKEDGGVKITRVSDEDAAAIRQQDEEAQQGFDITAALDPNYFTKPEIAMLTVGAEIGRLDRACLLIVEWLDRELSYTEARVR